MHYKGDIKYDDTRRLTGITYNALNLPSRIEVGSDAVSEAIMDYIYDGAGNKLGTRFRISYFSDRPLATYALQQPYKTEKHDYIGNYEFKDGQVHRVNTPYGYMAMGMFFTYLRDYQGNNRNHADYYAYGLPVQGSEVKDPDPYLYGGKEFYSLRGVNLYDFNARTYAPDIARFMQPDPNASDYHWLSPYSYCGGDPINFIDPTGCSTWVVLEPDGRYKVVGGDLNDNDLNIYVGTMQEGGTFIKESSIGYTPVITSFYNSDTGQWATDSYIDPNDTSGKEFINNMTGDNTPDLIEYISNAGNDGKYDFKTTNGTNEVISTQKSYTYRGMPMGKTESGTTIYTSARDIGNMVAGYVATAHGLSWIDMRFGFDAYQSYRASIEKKKIIFETEGVSSRNAQAYGRHLRLIGR